MGQLARLTYNEIEKLAHQWRIVIVLVLLTLIIVLIVVAAGRLLPPGSTAATASFAFVNQCSGFLFPASLCLIFGDMISGEMSSGTVKLLLTRPVSRWKIWISKFAAATLVSWGILLYTFAVAYIALGVKIGFGRWGDLIPVFTMPVYPTAWAETWRILAVEALAEASFVGLVLLLSTIVNSGVAGIGISFGAFLVGSAVIGIGEPRAWKSYIVFRHLDPGSHLIGIAAPGASTLAFSLGVLGAWLVACVALGLLWFQRRDILA